MHKIVLNITHKRLKIMHQDFDKIIKESLRKALQPIFTKVCGLQVVNFENVPKSLPRTIVRRTDLLKIATDTITGERKIYHVEFQAAKHPKWRTVC